MSGSTAATSPGADAPCVTAQVLRILEKMYDGKFWSIKGLAHATALSDQAVRNRLGDMTDQEWIEVETINSAHHYRITAKALLRPSMAAIEIIENHIGEYTQALLTEIKKEVES